jgi:hypothetical protein
VVVVVVAEAVVVVACAYCDHNNNQPQPEQRENRPAISAASRRTIDSKFGQGSGRRRVDGGETGLHLLDLLLQTIANKQRCDEKAYPQAGRDQKLRRVDEDRQGDSHREVQCRTVHPRLLELECSSPNLSGAKPRRVSGPLLCAAAYRKKEREEGKKEGGEDSYTSLPLAPITSACLVSRQRVGRGSFSSNSPSSPSSVGQC